MMGTHCMRGIRARGLAAGLAGWSIGVRAEAAQDTSASPTRLPDVVVTAARAPRESLSVPSTVHVVEAGDAVLGQGARTMPDALDGLPSVMLQKTSHGQGSPYLRGFTGFRTLSMVDGIRLNNSVFREGPNQYLTTVDPLSLRAFEVAMGPSSALYGSDAVGGAINALTLDPPESTGEPVWRRRVLLRGSTAERSGIGRIEIGGRPNQAFGFVAGLSLKTFGDLEGGRDVGRQRKTGYDELDFDAKGVGYLDEDSRVTLAHQTATQDDAWRTHRTPYGIDWEGLASGSDRVHSFDQRRDLTYARLESGVNSVLADSIQLTLFRHAQSEDQFREREDGRVDTQGFDVAAWGAMLQLTRSTDFAEWSYGAEYIFEEVESYARKAGTDGSVRSEIQGPVADDATYQTAGSYVQGSIPFLDGAFNLIPGLRTTHNRADADAVKDPVTGDRIGLADSWDAWTGSLRALVPLTRDGTRAIFGGVSQGFRSPNLSDLTRLDSARSNEMETPAPGLDPERFLSSEFGIRSRGDRFRAEAVYYHTVIDDLIVRTPTGRIVDELIEVTKKNSGSGYVQGVELTAEWDVTDDWHLRATGTWMEGRVDSYPTSDAEKRRDWMTRLMPPTTRLALRWQPPESRLWCEAVVDLADRADRLSAEDRRDTQRIPADGMPGYAVWHVRAGARIADGVQVSLALENVLDEDYRIHGSGLNEPGRNLIATVEYVF